MGDVLRARGDHPVAIPSSMALNFHELAIGTTPFVHKNQDARSSLPKSGRLLVWLGKKDSNLRMLESEPSALPDLAIPQRHRHLI